MGRIRQLVTSLDLDSFYDSTRRDAQELLPLSVRKLIVATTVPGTLGPLRMAAGDDIRLHGWDGHVELTVEHPYIPLGKSVWELGVASEPKTKADEDYEKRTADPRGIDPAQCTFVFVTPHIWAGKDTWTELRRAEGRWHDVRVIDGQVLSEWFDLTPAVAAWFHAERGSPIYDIDDIESGWFRVVEEPLDRAVPAELVIGGRVNEMSSLAAWLLEPTGDLTVSAESADEVVAFAIATVNESANQDPPVDLAPRVLVAQARDAVHYLAGLQIPHVVIVADPAIASDLRSARLKNVHLVLPVQAATEVPQPVTPGRLNLSPIKRAVVEDVLKRIGYDEDLASRIARESRGSLQAVLWGMGSRALTELPWLQEPDASLLAPLALARRWPVAEHPDQGMLEQLTDRQYQDIRLTATEWTKPGGPLQIWGECWDWKAWRVAWEHLVPHFAEDLVRRFIDVSIEVLGTRDPALDLDPDERWMASIHKKVHPYSSAFRDGLVSSLAMFGAVSDRIPSLDGQRVADTVVHRLLDSQRLADSWISLSRWLPDLAEAAPETFFTAAERLVADKEAVEAVFTEGGMFGSSPHTYLLWALERLAWNRHFLSRVVVLLGRFAEVDPGGSLLNRPHSSLRAILLPWQPGTSASSSQRLSAFDRLADKCPDVAWDCGISLLPSDHDWTSPIAAPEYREWRSAEPLPSTYADYQDFVESIADRLVVLVDSHPDRWIQLVRVLPSLIRALPDRADTVASTLLALDVSTWSRDNRRSMRDVLRELILHHEDFPDSDWSLDPSQLDLVRPLATKFTPDCTQDQHRWLFSDATRLPHRGERSWQEEQAAVSAARRKALEAVRKDDGIDGVIAWACDVESPESLGAVLAEQVLSDDEEQIVLRNSVFSESPEGEQTAKHRLGHGFVRSREQVRGTGWALDTLRQALLDWGVSNATRFSLSLNSDHSLWEMLDLLDSELATEYWSLVNPWFLNIDATETAVPRLLAAERPYAAISVVAKLTNGSATNREDNEWLSRVQALCVLVLSDIPEHAPDSEPGSPPLRWLANSVEEVLEFIDEHGPNTDDLTALVVKWEWHWLPALEHSARGLRALNRELSRSPRFFVDILTVIYRGETSASDTDSELQDESLASEESWERATQARKLLNGWTVLPGLELNSTECSSRHSARKSVLPATPAVSGTVDATKLHAWVTDARDLAEKANRLGVCDSHIGQVFAFAPADSDGSWPCSSVRASIELLHSQSLERSLKCAISNRRGVHRGGPTGEDERKIRDEFNGMASVIAVESPRTAAVLLSVAARYDAEARDRDEEGRRREFADE